MTPRKPKAPRKGKKKRKCKGCYGHTTRDNRLHVICELEAHGGEDGFADANGY